MKARMTWVIYATDENGNRRQVNDNTYKTYAEACAVSAEMNEENPACQAVPRKVMRREENGMDLFDKFAKKVGEEFRWIVKFEDTAGETHEHQVAGADAQDVADYVRKTNKVEAIYFIAKLDFDWR